MEVLRKADFRAVLGFLRAIYAVCDLEAFRTQLISTLPKVVPSDITAYNEVDPLQQRNVWCTEPAEALNFPHSAEVFDRHIPEHPLITHYAQTNDPRPSKLSDFLTRSRFHRLGIYNEFFRRLGVEHQMAFIIPAPRPLVIGVTVNRSSADFTERERLLLAILRPHLIQAFRNAQALHELELMKGALEKLDQGLIALTPEGRIRFITARAQRYLDEYFGGSARNEHLPRALSDWVRRHQACLRGTGALPPPRTPLMVERPGKRLVVRLLADRDQNLVLLDEQVSEVAPEKLERLGLSPRQAEVLAWVAQGKSNAEIAAILSINALTVKKHLAHIFDKLGVENRTSAAARAFELARVFLHAR